MSNRIFQAVWDNGPDARTDMLVLMALADCADAESASCYPSLAYIGRAARASRSVVIRALKSLQLDGWISVEIRKRGNGSQASNLYQINLERLGLSPLPLRGVKTIPPRGVKTKPLGVSERNPTGGVKTIPLEQTIYNKEPEALNMDLEGVTSFQRSSLLAGRSVVIGGQLVDPASPQAERLCALLRGASAQNGNLHHG